MLACGRTLPAPDTSNAREFATSETLRRANRRLEGMYNAVLLAFPGMHRSGHFAYGRALKYATQGDVRTAIQQAVDTRSKAE